MMPDTAFLAIYALLVVLRQWRLPLLWRLPVHRGPDWLFDARVGADHALRPRLLHRYRGWILGSSLGVEVLAAADLGASGRLAHVVWVQVPLLLALGLVRRVVTRAFLLRARDLAAPRADGRIALGFRSRRLADYTSGAFELLNVACTAGAVVVLARAADSRILPVAVLLAYCQIGGLLWKLALLRCPVRLPAERSDDYLRLVEDAFRIRMRAIDRLRGALAAVLVVLALKATWPPAGPARGDEIAGGLLAALAIFALWMIARDTRQQRSILARARELQVTPVRRSPPRARGRLLLGGLLYRDSDDPAIVVDGGPLRFAVNLGNRATYVYGAYWLGLAALFATVVGNL